MIGTLQKEPVFLELVQTDRKADFRWLAQSRGIPVEKVERLWQALRALADVEARPPLAPGRTSQRQREVAPPNPTNPSL